MREILAFTLVALCSSCAPALTVWEAPVHQSPSSVATYYLETTCEHCDRHFLEQTVSETVAIAFPQAHRIWDPALADVTVRRPARFSLPGMLSACGHCSNVVLGTCVPRISMLGYF